MGWKKCPVSIELMHWLIAKSKFIDWLLTAAALTGSYIKYRYVTDSLPAYKLTDVLTCSSCIALSDYLHQLHWQMLKAGGLFSDSMLHMIWLIACIGCIDWLVRACGLTDCLERVDSLTDWLELVDCLRDGSLQKTPAHNWSQFKFRTYAPLAFRKFRNIFEIEQDKVQRGGGDPSRLKGLPSRLHTVDWEQSFGSIFT